MIGENTFWEYNTFNEDKNIFLKKRTNSTFINEDEKIYKNIKGEKKQHQKVKNKYLLEQNNQTNDDNKENINDNMSFEDILKMSIQEKKNNDKIERDLKKANKINLMKIQRNKMILWNNNNNIKKFN
jgi:hypothetical protein